MSRVLIIGGSGRTGRLIADEANRLGHDVTITARDPRRLTDEGTLPQGIRVVRADVHDPASVLAAVKKVDAVIVAVSSSARGSGSASGSGSVGACHRALLHYKPDRVALATVLVSATTGSETTQPLLPRCLWSSALRGGVL